jgi:disulfide bond formation protein DsbB|tara:strand:+ start:782 stop:1267 length:486 start_codon:yes stop_codon:yes gene_type:complete
MPLIKNKFILNIILIFSLTSLIIAYFIQYILGHQPCNLCLIERIPYFAAVILISLILFLDKYEKIISLIVGLFFIFGTIVSFYHFGIEQGFFSESLVCDLADNNKAASAQDLLKQLEEKNISCKDVTFKLFGLSLATFNTIISLFLSVIMLKIVIYYGKNK